MGVPSGAVDPDASDALTEIVRPLGAPDPLVAHAVSAAVAMSAATMACGPRGIAPWTLRPLPGFHPGALGFPREKHPAALAPLIKEDTPATAPTTRP
jgi:hypothetical protein